MKEIAGHSAGGNCTSTSEPNEDTNTCLKRFCKPRRRSTSVRLKRAVSMTKRCKWMASFHDKLLFNIIIPASHDSAAYTFKPWHPYCWIGKHWAKTQDYSIYDQLCYGIRFLDLRLTESEGLIWTSHSFLCVPLEVCLHEIARFLLENPTEVVVVFAVRAWKMPLSWQACELAFQKSLGNSLIPFCMAKSECLGDITSRHRKNVALISEGMSIGWPSSSLSYCWPNVTDPVDLKRILYDRFREKGKRCDGFFWIKSEVTPSQAFVVKHFLTSGLRDLAELCHPFILSLIQSEVHSHSCNVISTDYVHDWIIDAIISSNCKRAVEG